MGSRVYKVFVAPLDETTPFRPGYFSPWTTAEVREVRIPDEYWDFLLDLSSNVSGTKEKTNELFTVTFYEYYETVEAPPKDIIVKAINIITRLELYLKNSHEIIPNDWEEYHDLFTNEECVRMLSDVKAVLNESVRLNKPYATWLE